MIRQSDLSPAFAGCSRAYAEIHLSAAKCLDGQPHDGTPCLLTDLSRKDEALRLLLSVPAGGDPVVLDASGRPILASERRVAS